MYWSKYNILSKSKKFGYLLYNTMSQVFLQIDDSQIQGWLELKDNPDSYKDYKFADFLISSRIIVKRQEDDLNIYLSDVLKNKNNSADVSLTILPTRGCNFGCIYCYERERPMVTMNEDTEVAIIRFVQSNKQIKRLNVTWYGGEPLINFGSIERLSRAFLALGIEYDAKIVTNGYLLTKEKADLFAELAINDVQITFDGPESVHNERRPLLGGQPTYRAIMENLKYLLQVNPTVHVDIRIQHPFVIRITSRLE